MGSFFEVIGSDGRLHLSSGTTALPILTFIGDLDTGLSHPSSDNLALSTGGTSRLTIDSGGTTQVTGEFQVQIPATNRKIIDGNGYWLDISKQYGTFVSGSSVNISAAANSTLQVGIGSLTISPVTSPTTIFNSSGISLSSGVLSIASTSNQLALSGPTRQVIINAPQPATASRTMTIPDVGSNSDFLLTNGTQTVNKTLTWNTGFLYSNLGTLSLPGLALNGTDKTSGFTGGSGGHNIIMVANAQNAIEADGDANTVVIGSFNVGIGGSPITNGLLTLSSTTKAFVPPRMTTTQRDLISSPSNGMMIFNTTSGLLNYYSGGWQDVAMGGGSVSFPLLAPDGTSSAPSYSFSSTTNTGMFYNTAGAALTLAQNGQSLLATGTSNQRIILRTGTDPFASFLLAADTASAVLGSSVSLYLSNPLIRWGTSAQMHLTASTPSVDGRTINLPDVGSNSDVVCTTGAQTISGSKYFSTQQTFINGNSSTPSIAWNSETNSGFYQVTGGLWGATTQGNVSTFFSVNGLQANTGTLSEPGYTFAADTDTGMRRSAANTISLVAGATDICEVRTAGIRPAADNTLDNGESGRRWANVWGTTLHSGDIELDNHWKITEGDKVGHPEEGVMLLSPTGKKYKISMTEVE